MKNQFPILSFCVKDEVQNDLNLHQKIGGYVAINNNFEEIIVYIFTFKTKHLPVSWKLITFAP